MPPQESETTPPPTSAVAPILSYATWSPPEPRWSKLATVSVFTSILASPCLWAWAFDYLPGPRSGPYAMPCTVAIALVTLAIPVVAIVRTRRSRGRLLGGGVAAFALFLWLLFWGLTGIAYYILTTMTLV